MAKPEDLEPLVGTWAIGLNPPVAESEPGGAECTFEWLSGRQQLLQRWRVPAPEAPDGLAVITLDSDGQRFLQHYFDSRGVVRLYQMTFERRLWMLSRTEPDFSPLDFSQRFVGELSDDANTIAGRWEIAEDGEQWRLDFELFYARIG